MIWYIRAHLTSNLNSIRPGLTTSESKFIFTSTPLYFPGLQRQCALGCTDFVHLVVQAICNRLHRLCALGCTGYVQWKMKIKRAQPSLSFGLKVRLWHLYILYFHIDHVAVASEMLNLKALHICIVTLTNTKLDKIIVHIYKTNA